MGRCSATHSWFWQTATGFVVGDEHEAVWHNRIWDSVQSAKDA